MSLPPSSYETLYDNEDDDFLTPPRNTSLSKKVYKLEQMNEVYFRTCEKTAEQLEQFLDQMQVYLGRLYNIKLQICNIPEFQNYVKELDVVLDSIRDQCHDLESCVFDLDDALYRHTENDIDDMNDNNNMTYPDCCAIDDDDEIYQQQDG